MPGVDCRLIDQNGHDVPFDGVSQGEVLLRGPWIIERYHKPGKDTGQFLAGYWRSGDLATIDPYGYLKLTDRLKDVIKSGGEWISSIDMENAITAHPRITEAAVIGAWHPTWQERPVVLAVTGNGQEIPIADIHQLLSGSFATWQLPDKILYLDALPAPVWASSTKRPCAPPTQTSTARRPHRPRAEAPAPGTYPVRCGPDELTYYQTLITRPRQMTGWRPGVFGGSTGMTSKCFLAMDDASGLRFLRTPAEYDHPACLYISAYHGNARICRVEVGRDGRSGRQGDGLASSVAGWCRDQ